jgi:hypothetical protein
MSTTMRSPTFSVSNLWISNNPIISSNPGQSKSQTGVKSSPSTKLPRSTNNSKNLPYFALNSSSNSLASNPRTLKLGKSGKGEALSSTLICNTSPKECAGSVDINGKGQTVYFNQTVIIFTSNIGASDLSDPQTGAIIRTGIMTEVQKQGIAAFSYAQVDAHFPSEVHWHFTSRIGRAELLNRLGDSIVVFDLLRSEFVWQIGEKFLRQLAESAWDKYYLLLLFQTSVLEILSVHMQAADNIMSG